MSGLDAAARKSLADTKKDEEDGTLTASQAELFRNDIVKACRERNQAGSTDDCYVTPPKTQEPAGVGAPGASGSTNPTAGGSTPRSLFSGKSGGRSGFVIQHTKPDGSVVEVVPSDTSVRKGKVECPCEHCGKVLKRPSGLATHLKHCKGKGKGPASPAADPQRSLFDKHKVRATAHFFVCERQFRIHLFAAEAGREHRPDCAIVSSCYTVWDLFCGVAGLGAPVLQAQVHN